MVVGVYLLRHKEMNVFKVGRSCNIESRVESYGGDWSLIKTFETDSCIYIENEILNIYRKHFKIWKGREYFVCDNDKIITQFDEICSNKIQLSNTEIDTNRHTCPTCKKQFKHKRYLKGHIKRDTCVSHSTCEYCGIDLTKRKNRRSVQYHISYCKKKHNNQRQETTVDWKDECEKLRDENSKLQTELSSIKKLLIEYLKK